MPVDSLQAARLFRKMRDEAIKRQPFDAGVMHEVKAQDAFDPSLSQRLVYGKRADWYVAAAVNGFFDVDAPAEAGVRYYPVANSLYAAPKMGLY